MMTSGRTVVAAGVEIECFLEALTAFNCHDMLEIFLH
jgi:hypothetical protein